MEAEAFPLDWPTGWPRTAPEDRKEARYQVTYEQAVRELQRELKRMKATDIVISTNLPTKGNGEPYANMVNRKIEDPGVAVHWRNADGEPEVIPCDAWTRVKDNIRAVGLAIQCLRGLERTGSGQIMKRAFMGMKALPPIGGTSYREAARKAWHTVLGVDPDATREDINRAFREKARESHPDQGGDSYDMAVLNEARREGLAQAERTHVV